jgi:hypothetical protein
MIDEKYTCLNPGTGELYTDAQITEELDYLTIMHATSNHLNTKPCIIWYPCFDWCGRYIGSVMHGQYVDKSNIHW